ncbi:phosphate ABC transporter substrate-binding protein PstS [Legionella bononiensis]|uniref:Phosphate-binding protein PstS n=1 Tax=Legionella bononiensis TaxID=2793102 RepID=A0ABS1WEC8_9GAMM|nr:phosphate ABC transporter substrate-binding protein PstS [Legionella bononiensis]MBL7479421.1 phosphate ABC transporter substrate-binding protein PstS [Legionella bononiensis]MBL7527706.1 phosphate ABC transporter substrate-binding protein PstS [Legionella bononiensis]MBL7563611.1 phosphate ABC transporter substrate-binding protein PstS [Legionella bononiensis]
MKLKSFLVPLIVGIINANSSYASLAITGAGATFPYPVYAKWAEAYHNKTGTQVNYQSIGSGGGIQQIKAGTVDFGASDKPLTDAELQVAGLIQFPTVLGAVVPVVNVQGIKSGELKLTGQLLADIFLGTIKKWSDPALVALNPDLKLPDQNITVVHRSDGSGTSFLFTNYLSKISPDWEQKVGNDVSVKWPVGVAGKGNEGVALYVKQISGSIGYVEYSYATSNHLSAIQLKNKENSFVNASMDSVQAAAQYADWNKTPVILTNEPGTGSWPITGATFILMHSQVNDANKEQSKAVLEFFNWAYANGKADANKLNYVTLPDTLIEQIKMKWASDLHDEQGKAIWTN